jgi:1-acyl-sn-glycerol-3-phosphate acyltransferase
MSHILQAAFRATWRSVVLVAHLAAGFVQTFYLRSRLGEAWHQSARGQATISVWVKRLAKILGLQVRVASPPLPVPTMVVANHVSWLDIIAIGSVHPAYFLAKDDVRRWPFIGSLLARAGTKFIRRNSASAVRECNKHLCHLLRIRHSVVVFPEGTTTDGANVGSFQSALFEVPRQAYCPVQPLAIRYSNQGKPDVIAPYIDDDIFIIHLWRILGRKFTCVELNFLPPVSSREHRRQLSQKCHAIIAAALVEEENPIVPIPVLYQPPRRPVRCELMTEIKSADTVFQ